MSELPIIALITDFGIEDSYTGSLRGVLAGIAPHARILDITHSIPAGDIRRGGLVLWETQPFLPTGTVFLLVVDPGVGANRKGAIFRFPVCDVVCPDNGTATFLMERFPDFLAREISNKKLMLSKISNTFHGRDIFAPAAAHVACGTPMEQFGAEISDPFRSTLPTLSGNEERGWEGEVLYTDHFGNVVTSIGQLTYDCRTLNPWIGSDRVPRTIKPGSFILLEDGSKVEIARTYADASDDVPMVSLVNSSGLIEIAAYKTPAGNHPALQSGARVFLKTTS